MNTLFAETLKQLRKEKGLSQIQMGNLMFVNNSTIARWVNGSRLPDAVIMSIDTVFGILRMISLNKCDDFGQDIG